MLGRINASADYLSRAVERGEQIYGVTTLFGGMADHVVPQDQVAELQASVVGNLKASTGTAAVDEDVRAAMLLRANSLMHGVSALRLEVLERFPTFLNAGATPHVFEVGSIGASGDLVPLAYIAGAILGLGPKYLVDMDGETLDGTTALTPHGAEADQAGRQGRPGAGQRHVRLGRHRGQLRLAGRRACCAVAMAAHAMLHPGAARHRPVVPALRACAQAASRAGLDGARDAGA